MLGIDFSYTYCNDLLELSSGGYAGDRLQLYLLQCPAGGVHAGDRLQLYLMQCPAGVEPRSTCWG